MTLLGILTAKKVEQDGPPNSGEFSYIDIGSIDNKSKQIIEPKRLPSDSAPSRARQRLRVGDVLVSMTRPSLNAVAIVPPELDGSIGSTGFHVLRANESVLPLWLYYGVQGRGFVEAMSKLVQGALYPAVRPRDIQAFDLPTPEIAEQRRIVAEIEKQFSRLDKAVANLQRVKLQLTRYLESALDRAFCMKPNAILADLVERGPQNGLYLPKSSYGAGTPILRIDDYQKDWIRPVDQLRQVAAGESQLATWSLVEGDLVINRVNSLSHLGKCISVPRSIDGVLFESNMMRLHLSARALPRYVELYLGSRLGRTRLTSNAKWAVNQASINQQDVLSTAVPVPDIDRQSRIVADLDRRLSITREVEAEVDANLKRAQALRQAILARAFGGAQ